MTTKFIGYAALIACSLPLASVARAASIFNGSFESASIDPGAGFIPLPLGSAAIDGWRVGAGGIDYIGGYWQAAHGNRSIDLSRLGQGTMVQILATVVGQSYRVDFSMAGNPDGGPTIKTMGVIASGGGELSLYTFDITGRSRAAMGWARHSYFFTAVESSIQLGFLSADATPYGPALDDVSIAAVPEASTWALLILGMGAVGGALRHRRKQLPAIASA